MYLDTMRAKDIVHYFNQEGCIIIDLRKNTEYQKKHIPGAINIPYEEFDEYMSVLQGYETIILYCERGNLSLIAARELKHSNNAEHIISVVGGYLAYQQYFH